MALAALGVSEEKSCSRPGGEGGSLSNSRGDGRRCRQRRGLADDVASSRRRLSGNVNISTGHHRCSKRDGGERRLSERRLPAWTVPQSAAASFTVNGTNSSSAFSSIQTNSSGRVSSRPRDSLRQSTPGVTPHRVALGLKPHVVTWHAGQGVGRLWNATARCTGASFTRRAAEAREGRRRERPHAAPLKRRRRRRARRARLLPRHGRRPWQKMLAEVRLACWR